VKSIRRLFVFVGVISVVCVLALVVTSKMRDRGIVKNKKQPLTSAFSTPTPMAISAIPLATPLVTLSKIKEKPIERNVLLEVPFIVQAPGHNWKDPIFQNACEEAVVLMAMRWAESRALTNEEAFIEIQKISNFSKTHYGFYLDQSAKDLTLLMQDYFKYPNVSYREDVQTSDIKTELEMGNLVLVPVNGQKLGNPYFTQPGPTKHMLLVKGYDAKTNEFITNDPGIGKGNSYRYKEQVLDKALQNYPSGYHGKITIIEKVMIVVEKKKE
jgi:hypothetical protein